MKFLVLLVELFKRGFQLMNLYIGENRKTNKNPPKI